MRFLCCYTIKQEDELVKKVEVISVDTEIEASGILAVINNLCTNYCLPFEIEEDKEKLGIHYIRRQRTYSPDGLAESFTSEDWDNYNLYGTWDYE